MISGFLRPFFLNSLDLRTARGVPVLQGPSSCTGCGCGVVCGVPPPIPRSPNTFPRVLRAVARDGGPRRQECFPPSPAGGFSNSIPHSATFRVSPFGTPAVRPLTRWAVRSSPFVR